MNTLQTYSKKGLHASLSLLFIVIPIVYAWIYIPWIPVTLADIFPLLGGFEKVKVLFFLVFITVAAIFFLGTWWLTKKHLVWIGFFSIWTLISYGVNRDINPYFWFGNGEKNHGWLFYLWLLILGIILSTSTREEQKKYLKISLFSGGMVCLYALFQKLGLDPIQSLYSSRLDATRIFGTLWNPNYLAGYILMLLPLSFLLTRSNKILWWGLFGLFTYVLFLTKSLFGIGIFAGYLYYLIVYRYVPLRQNTRHIVTITLIGGLTVIGEYTLAHYGEQILEIQKIKGFIARYFLWETGIHTIFWDIRNTLFGYGPDGFLPISELFRSPELSLFEDPAFRIDRSHNVWIDMLIHFGVPIGVFIIYSIFHRWTRLPLSLKEILVIFSIFFFFNIPVLVHLVLLIQILMLCENDQKPAFKNS